MHAPRRARRDAPRRRDAVGFVPARRRRRARSGAGIVPVVTARLRPLEPLPAYRQSLTTAFAVCPRRTRFALQGRGNYATGYTESSADLGTVFHAVAAG